MKQVFRGRGLWALVALGLLSVAGVKASAAELPEYNIERCCDLCPLTAYPSSYDTGYLKNFKMLVQGKDGWLFRSEAELVEQFGPNLEGLKHLKRFARHLKQTTGTELVMVFQPTKGLVHPNHLPATSPVPFSWNVARKNYADALMRFRQAGLVVPDLTPLLDEETREDAFFFKRDHHWTPYGARRTAEVVAERIKDMPAYQSLSQQEFVTRRSGLIRKDGSLQDAVKRICGFEYGSQYVDEFRTESSGTGQSAEASALFGDQDLPPITLVGTSNSKGAQDYNFVGALQEFLGVEVLNVAVAGGSYDGSMFEYLLSDNFRESPPKIMIWEVPGYHNLDSAEFYRQVTPMISGACESQEPVLQKTTPVKAGTTEVLYNGGGQFIEMPSNEYVVDLQFSDPGVKEVDAFIWYVFGRKDRVDMEYGDRVETPGRFVFELPEGPNWNDEMFMSLDLALKPEQVSEGLTVTTKICRRQDI
ncbi:MULTISPECIES: alginate O-acetyltransferase AlgX-related protein [Marinobacter]|jgi:alginate biosynthesis protein AlgX|uniref:Alginate biosynthesis protein AlgX n=3 Tax=Marinobacter TaxID=2742 RepID=A0A1W6KEI1_9GAMM|nr:MULTISPECIES: alginate biosynthesis protein AlgX [Marinobacter]ARM85855.1 alginate biosynthesis protein AlgX [Marinobacter salarius]KXJ46977.1 MAG: oxidoreductase [Marinobacter sp. Hex_13]MBJ7299085.1 oxidoreductase [Marinobacter salarius]MBS8232154.1 oxidoreductase [Marinobacter salarius]MCC4284133.1 alginate O-acetyltransferase [Marinobacter salarius]|tara:strand:+ start:1897 stop:3321 length:1425 start_codon:yes stop_codon:yes gene_type:complete